MIGAGGDAGAEKGMAEISEKYRESGKGFKRRTGKALTTVSGQLIARERNPAPRIAFAPSTPHLGHKLPVAIDGCGEL